MAIETVRHIVPSLSLSFFPLRCLLCTMGRGWPEKEWIVGCPDPPNRGLFIEGVLQENYMNYFKMIIETSPLTPSPLLYPVIYWVLWKRLKDGLSASPTPLLYPQTTGNSFLFIQTRQKFTFDFWILNRNLDLGDVSYLKPSEGSYLFKKHKDQDANFENKTSHLQKHYLK